MSEVSRLSTDVQRALWPGDSGVFSFGYSSSTFFLLHFPPGSSAELLLKFLDLSLALSLQAFHPDLMRVQIHTRFSPWLLSTIHSVAWPIPSFSRFFFTQPFLPTPVFLGLPCGSWSLHHGGNNQLAAILYEVFFCPRYLEAAIIFNWASGTIIQYRVLQCILAMFKLLLNIKNSRGCKVRI